MLLGAVGCGSAIEGDPAGSMTGSSSEDSSSSSSSESGSNETPGTSTTPGTTTVTPGTTTTDPIPPPTTGPVPMPPDLGPVGGLVEGRYLLAMFTTLSPTTPIQFVASVENSDAGPWMSLQPLSLNVGSTDTPREPVGELISTTGVSEGAAGFRFEFQEVELVGAANPITGADIVGNFTLIANCGLCGPLEGEVVVPLDYDLAGSTFSSVMLDGGPLPPAPPEACVDCL